MKDLLLVRVIDTGAFQESGFRALGTGASCGFMLALRSLLTGAGSKVGRPVAEVVVVQVDETLLSKPGGKLLLRRLGMASLSFSKPSSESEQVFSLKVTVGFSLGLWMAWKVSWVLSRLLTALRDVHTFGGREGSARRSVMRPWASPITAISTVMLVPDWDPRGPLLWSHSE